MLLKKATSLITLASISALLLSSCALRPEETPPHPTTRNSIEAAKDNINLAIDYLQAQDPTDAKRKLMLAISEEPNYAPTWYTMAYYEEVTNKLKEAERDYKRAIALAPQDGQTHNNYGTFLCRHGKYAKAIDEFVTAANEPDYVHIAGAYENAGICALMIPDNEAAKGFFLQALNNDPNRKMSLYELAKIYHDEDEESLSKVYFSRYAKLTNVKPNQYKKIMAQRQVLRR